ncbi:hypothetical protein ACFZB9_18655 [Kitasatospora sp. NPDC008050]|uniref:hypothetical protein n=1 Tax=Kitasatospora sp. NPDC008050 TaxID=3364021 RepID=UPI0036E62E92
MDRGFSGLPGLRNATAVLQAYTATGHSLSGNAGYIRAALIGCVVFALVSVVVIVVPRRGRTVPADTPKDEEAVARPRS